MTKKELLNKIEKQQEIIDALFSHLKLGYKEEEYIQKSFIGESKIKTRIVVYESYLESKKKQKKETLEEIMKDLPDIMRGKDFPTKHGILPIGKLISKKK